MFTTRARLALIAAIGAFGACSVDHDLPPPIDIDPPGGVGFEITDKIWALTWDCGPDATGQGELVFRPTTDPDAYDVYDLADTDLSFAFVAVVTDDGVLSWRRDGATELEIGRFTFDSDTHFALASSLYHKPPGAARATCTGEGVAEP